MIKHAFHPGNYPKKVDVSLLLLRLVAGGFMLTHGMGKFAKLLSGDPIQFADPIGVGVTASLALAVFSEVFCSIFSIIGFATRLSGVPLIITMLVAAFIVQAGAGFGKQELPLLYATIYLILVVAGAGKISLDKWVYDRIGNH
jgi:putative oxidoreductase